MLKSLYRHSAAAVSAAVLTLCCSIHINGQNAAADCIRPPFLKKGDTVAVIATSYQPADSSVARTCRVLESWGLEPVVAENIKANPLPDIEDTVSYYAGDAFQRASCLRWAMEDDAVKAVFCANGGYGAMQTLSLVPEESFTLHPKWIIGYSDVTAIHCAAFEYGVMSIHGPMGKSLGSPEDQSQDVVKLHDLLFGDIPSYEIPAHQYNTSGHAEGTFIGGNMITMAALSATRFNPASKEGIILFIEEIDENMHAIDRLFNMLILQGRLSGLKGIVFGDFQNCDRDLPYRTVEEMLYQYTSGLGIPVCYGFPAGHGDINMPLVEGAKVVLDVNENGTELSFR